MVKIVLSFFLLLGYALADDLVLDGNESAEIIVKDDPLTEKIKGFLCPQTYTENRDFIRIIFDPKEDYYINNRVDAVKVIQTLKDNGLLDLFFKSPQEIRLNFKTNGSPVFFVKILSDTLSTMGYYKYVTIASKKDASAFVWSISLRSEYATDPLLLQKALRKKNCEIVDIQRASAKEWTYAIDISHAHLNLKQFQDGEEYIQKRSLEEPWFDVSKISQLQIQSSRRNRWYPYIAYYDASLHLLKVIKRDEVTKYLFLEIPKNAVYVKISDLYTLKNIKYELTFYPKGSR